jgi:hypothetical protein
MKLEATKRMINGRQAASKKNKSEIANNIVQFSCSQKMETVVFKHI